MTEDTVQVYVYDLSQGLARVYSPMLLGILIDAIYHTSVVIRNKEYYLDQGIKVNSPPGHTKYGTPIEVLEIGTTGVDDELLNDFINELKNHDEMKYHAVNYNLFTNNCNHFTDVVIDFYVAKFRGQDIKVARHGVKHTKWAAITTNARTKFCIEKIYTFLFFTTNLTPMLSNDSADYRNKFWSSTSRQVGTSFQPLGKEESYANRYP